MGSRSLVPTIATLKSAWKLLEWSPGCECWGAEVLSMLVVSQISSCSCISQPGFLGVGACRKGKARVICLRTGPVGRADHHRGSRNWGDRVLKGGYQKEGPTGVLAGRPHIVGEAPKHLKM